MECCELLSLKGCPIDHTHYSTQWTVCEPVDLSGSSVLGTEHELLDMGGRRSPSEMAETLQLHCDETVRAVRGYADDSFACVEPWDLRCIQYNCVGFVFGGSSMVIDPDWVDVILRDAEYEEMAEADLEVDDLVVYRDGRGFVEHVGVVAAVSAAGQPLIQSKWGWLCQFTHAPSAYSGIDDSDGLRVEFYHSYAVDLECATQHNFVS